MTAEPRRHLNPSSEEDDDELDTPYANADARLNGLPPTARSSSFESHVSQPQPPIEEEDRDDGAGPLDPAAEAEDGSSALLNEEEEDSLPPMAQGGRFSSGSRSRGERRFGLGVLGGGNGGFKGELAGNSLPPTHGRKRSESVTIGSDMESFVRHSAVIGRASTLAEPTGSSAEFWTEPSRAQDVADAVQRFNGKPKDGLKFMRARKLLEPELAPSNEGVDPSLLEDDARAIATFLHHSKGLSKRVIGDFLGEPGEHANQVRLFYTRAYDFEGMPFVDALRAYLTPFRLPGEAQKIDRIMNCYSARYHEANPAVFSCEDTAYVLAFSLIMLNTDQHSTNVTRKMTEVEFIRNNRGIDRGQNVQEHILSAAYHDIRRTEIKTTTEFDELSQHELISWLAHGSVFIKFTHGRVGAFKTPHHEIKLWISADKLCYRNLSKRGKAAVPEKQLPLSFITEVIVGAKSSVFRRHGVARQSTQDSSSVAQGETGEVPSDRAYISLVMNQRTLDLQAGTPELGDFWGRYFKQVVERSRLEATARGLALRAQPRERLMELATKEWSTNILPNWTEMRHAEQTRLLWWEGIPSSERGRVWLCVLGETEKGEKGGELSADANLVGGRAKAGSKEEEAVRTAGEWLDEQLPSEHAELSQLYAAANSPFRSDAVSLLASLQLQLQGLSQHGKVHIRECAPTAPLIAGMLLIHLEPPLAYAALKALVKHHVPGATDPEAVHWRNIGFTLVLEQELPSLAQALASAGVTPLDYFLPWLHSLLVPLFCIETASRLWDCYMRDGEVFVWRAALQLLRRRAGEVIAACAEGKEAALAKLMKPVDPAVLTEKVLFKGMQENEDSVVQWLHVLNQRLPLPEQCWDLFANSYDSDPPGDDGQAHYSEGQRKQSRLSKLFTRRPQEPLATVEVTGGHGPS